MGAPSYDTLASAVIAARVRLLDAMAGLTGDILTDTLPQTLVCINTGWREMQENLSKLGFQKFTGQVFRNALAVVNPGDQATQTRLDWAGYFNGTSTQAGIVLPSDFILPMPNGIDERISGSGANFTALDDLSGSGL